MGRAAVHWAERSGLTTDDQDLSYLHESQYLALVRVRIAQGRNDPKSAFLPASLRLLDRLQQEAERVERMDSVLEILILRALALHALDKQQQAMHALARAVTLAEPEGYVRPFVDEGKPMGCLLTQLQATGHGAQEYIQTLLAACDPCGSGLAR